MTKLPINVREGGIELLEELAPLWEQLRHHHAQLDGRWSDEILAMPFSSRRSELENKTASRVFLVDSDITPIAYGICSVEANRQGEIDSIYVRDSYRGRGIGKVIMQRGIAWLQSQDVTEISVSVLPTNSHAVRFYEKYGFVSRSVRMLRARH